MKSGGVKKARTQDSTSKSHSHHVHPSRLSNKTSVGVKKARTQDSTSKSRSHHAHPTRLSSENSLVNTKTCSPWAIDTNNHLRGLSHVGNVPSSTSRGGWSQSSKPYSPQQYVPIRTNPFHQTGPRKGRDEQWSGASMPIFDVVLDSRVTQHPRQPPIASRSSNHDQVSPRRTDDQIHLDQIHACCDVLKHWEFFTAHLYITCVHRSALFKINLWMKPRKEASQLLVQHVQAIPTSYYGSFDDWGTLERWAANLYKHILFHNSYAERVALQLFWVLCPCYRGHLFNTENDFFQEHDEVSKSCKKGHQTCEQILQHIRATARFCFFHEVCWKFLLYVDPLLEKSMDNRNWWSKYLKNKDNVRTYTHKPEPNNSGEIQSGVAITSSVPTPTKSPLTASSPQRGLLMTEQAQRRTPANNGVAITSSVQTPTNSWGPSSESSVTPSDKPSLPPNEKLVKKSNSLWSPEVSLSTSDTSSSSYEDSGASSEPFTIPVRIPKNVKVKLSKVDNNYEVVREIPNTIEIPSISGVKSSGNECQPDKNVLLLGMSCGAKTYGRNELISESLYVKIQTAIEDGRLCQMSARDLVRILHLEKTDVCRAYTVSSATHTDEDDLNTQANFAIPKVIATMSEKYGQKTAPFYSITLDYYWLPASYLKIKVGVDFFRKVLCSFVTENLLATSTHYDDDMGTIWLPFSFYFLECTVKYASTLKTNFIITFITSSKKESVPLLKSTYGIDETFMNDTLGKRINQEDSYCVVPPANLDKLFKNLSLPHTPKTKSDLKSVVGWLKSTKEAVMFIRFKAFKSIPPSKKSKVKNNLDIFLSKTLHDHFSNKNGGIHLDIGDYSIPPETGGRTRATVTPISLNEWFSKRTISAISHMDLENGVLDDTIKHLNNKYGLICPKEKRNKRADSYLHVLLPPGLKNKSNCCYAVVALQLLSAIVPFWRIITTCVCDTCNDDAVSMLDTDTFEDGVLSHLIRVMCQLKYGPNAVYPTSDISDFLGFSTDSMHQDVHQFLTSLLEEDVTEDRHSKITNDRTGMCPMMKEQFNRMFGCQETYISICNVCKYRKDKYSISEMAQISINVQQLVDKQKDMSESMVQALFSGYFETEIQDDPNNLLVCDSCTEKKHKVKLSDLNLNINDESDKEKADKVPVVLVKTEQTIQKQFLEVPKIMFVSFRKHYENVNGEIDVYENGIQIPEELIYHPTGESSCSNKSVIKYIVFGKIYYEPSLTEPDKGHYTCDVRDWVTGVWYHCDDYEVKKVTKDHKSSKNIMMICGVEEGYFLNAVQEHMKYFLDHNHVILETEQTGFSAVAKHVVENTLTHLYNK